MSQSKFRKGDRVKLKYANPDAPSWVVIEVMPFKFNTKSPPLITIRREGRLHGVLENEIILESESQENR